MALIIDKLEHNPLLGDEPLFEIENGQKVEIPPMGLLEGIMASYLSQVMGNFAYQKGMGIVVIETNFALQPDARTRRPDLAFVSFVRWKEAPPPETDIEAWHVVPNLAVEVVSKSNTADEIAEKVKEYLAAGVELVWVIYPRQRQAHVFRPQGALQVLEENEELQGEQVLPGFKIKLADVLRATEMPR